MSYIIDCSGIELSELFIEMVCRAKLRTSKNTNILPITDVKAMSDLLQRKFNIKYYHGRQIDTNFNAYPFIDSSKYDRYNNTSLANIVANIRKRQKQASRASNDSKDSSNDYNNSKNSKDNKDNKDNNVDNNVDNSVDNSGNKELKNIKDIERQEYIKYANSLNQKFCNMQCVHYQNIAVCCNNLVQTLRKN